MNSSEQSELVLGIELDSCKGPECCDEQLTMNSPGKSTSVLQTTANPYTGVQYRLNNVPGPRASYWEARNYLEQLLHELSVVQLGDSGYGLQLFKPKDLPEKLENPIRLYKTIVALRFMLTEYNTNIISCTSMTEISTASATPLQNYFKKYLGHSYSDILFYIRFQSIVTLLLTTNNNLDTIAKASGLYSDSFANKQCDAKVGVNPGSIRNAVRNQDWKTLKEKITIPLLTPKQLTERQPPKTQIDYPAFLQSCDLPLQWNESIKKYEFCLPVPPAPYQKEEQRQQLVELVGNIARVPLLGGGHFVQFDAAEATSFLESPEEISLALQVLRYGLKHFSDESLAGVNILSRFLGKDAHSAFSHGVHQLFSRKKMNIMPYIRLHAVIILLQQGWSPTDIYRCVGLNNQDVLSRYIRKNLGITPTDLQHLTPISPQNMPEEWKCEVVDGEPQYFLKKEARG